MSLQPGQHVGPYRVVRLLGAGGMGEVYEAVHERIARQVAIKILHAGLAENTETAGRFLNEARAVNIVRHPGLVQISDYGQLPDGTTYIVMEYLAGESLAAHLERLGGTLPELEVLLFAQQIALALAAAHQKGILHRDLKPANTMLVPDSSVPGGLRVKLLDFGIAKVGVENQAAGVDLVRTTAGQILGSPIYMSPEHLHGAEHIVPASDIYSFGAMLYHLLSGGPPFTGDSPADVFGKHLFTQATPLIERAPKVSPALAALVDKMLRKKAAERPTMSDVVREIGLCLRAHHQGSSSWLRLRRRVAIGVACSLVALSALWIALSGVTSHGSGAARCNSAGFCGEQLPAGVTRLRAITVFSEHDIWACGDPSVVIHFDGQRWTSSQVGSGNRLHGMFGFSSSDLWVVGDNGAVLHFDGKRWQRVDGLPSAYFTAIWGASPDDLWVVGKVLNDEAAMLHYTGTWQPVASGTAQTLLNIWGLRKNRIYAVGHQGTILRFDGKKWLPFASVPTKTKLTGVWGSGEQDIFAVGHGGVVLHYNGEAWTSLASQTPKHVNAVWGDTASDVWMVGDQGLVLHYDGERMTPLDSGVTGNFDSLGGFGPTRVWLTGEPALLLQYRR